MLNKDRKKKEKELFLSFLREFTYIILWPIKCFILCTISGKKLRAPDSLTNKNGNDDKNSQRRVLYCASSDQEVLGLKKPWAMPAR